MNDARSIIWWCWQRHLFSYNNSPSEKYHIPIPMRYPDFVLTMLAASYDNAGSITFFHTKTRLPKSITYRFPCDIPILYEWCSQHHMMMLAASLFAYKNTPTNQYYIPIPMWYPDFVWTMLAALYDDAGSVIFCIQKLAFQKVSHTDSHVISRFCMNDARSIIL